MKCKFWIERNKHKYVIVTHPHRFHIPLLTFHMNNTLMHVANKSVSSERIGSYLILTFKLRYFQMIVIEMLYPSKLLLPEYFLYDVNRMVIRKLVNNGCIRMFA